MRRPGHNAVIHTLFEHESLPYSVLGEGADAFIAAVEQINGSGVELLRLGRKSVSAMGYVGVVTVGDVCLQVLPKIDYSIDPEKSVRGQTVTDRECQEWSAVRNLLAMLGYAYGLPVQQREPGAAQQTTGTWIEILIALFSDELERQLLSGPDRQYMVRDESLGFLKGKWRISEQLTRHPHRKHRFDLSLDELNEDTGLNRIFLYVCRRLLFLTRELASWRRLQRIIALLNGATMTVMVTSEILDQVHFNRLNRRYEKAFRMARLFLENQVIVLRAGRIESFIFMLSMHGLFEKFIFGFLKKHYLQILPSGSGLHLLSQGSGRSDFAAYRERDGSGVFRLKPDILLQDRAGHVQLVLDTKYKRLESSSDVSAKDVYQLGAYQSALACRRGLLLYPSVSGVAAVRELFRYSGREGQLLAATVDVHQPLHRKDGLVRELRGLMDRVMEEFYLLEVRNAANG